MLLVTRMAMPAAQSLSKTPLYQTHLSLGARMVPFAGWEMPLQYQGILAETRAVRSQAGIFDVSHMGRLYFEGRQSAALLDWVLTANVAALNPGQAKYTLICNESGGVIDDAIVYNLGDDRYLLVCNASNRPSVAPWLERWRRERFSQVRMTDRTLSSAMVALQGPMAVPIIDGISNPKPSALRLFSCFEHVQVGGKEAFVGRTGYTGEDGFEIICPPGNAPYLWGLLCENGAAPCGLGARDVLRLEAGLLLHGNDMDPATTPLEAGLGRFVRLDKDDFVGAAALRQVQRDGVRRCLVGFALVGKGIARAGHTMLSDGKQIGRVTSGTYSPTLDKSIGLGYVPPEYASPGTRFHVDIRGRSVEAEVVPLPFYSRKKA